MPRGCRRESCNLCSYPLPCPSNCSSWCFSSSRQVVMLRNDIHHCKASGIFLRLSVGGLIADINIHSNGEAGVDIRKGTNPIVLVRTPPSCAGGHHDLSPTRCFSLRGSRDRLPEQETLTFLLALPFSLCLRYFDELDKPQGQGAVKCYLMVHSWSPALFGGLKTAALGEWGHVPLTKHPCAMSELLQARQSSVPLL